MLHFDAANRIDRLARIDRLTDMRLAFGGEADDIKQHTRYLSR